MPPRRIPGGCGGLIPLGCFGSPNHQDRNGTVPQDVLGIAAHHDSANATTAMGTANDQLCGPLAGLLDDALAGVGSQGLDQTAVDRHAGGACGSQRIVENGLSTAVQLIAQRLHSGWR